MKVKGGEEQNPSSMRSSHGLECNLCFLQSKVTPTVYRSVLEDFLLPCAAGVYADAELIFQQELAPAHTARRLKPWFNVH